MNNTDKIQNKCLCWKLELTNHKIFGFTDHDNDITFDGVIFKGSSGMNPSVATSKLGLATSDLEISGAISSIDINKHEIEKGTYNNAKVSSYSVNWQNPEQRSLLSVGTIGEIIESDNTYKCEVRSIAYQINQSRGRLFKYECDAILGDTRCGININNSKYKANCIVNKIITPNSIELTQVSNKEKHNFSNGILEINNIKNIKKKFQIKTTYLLGNNLQLICWEKISEHVKISDNVTLYVGCNKSFSTCKKIFKNHLNYQGFPHIPGNDFVLSYPSKDDIQNNGNSFIQK